MTYSAMACSGMPGNGSRLTGTGHAGLLRRPDRCVPLPPYGYLPAVGMFWCGGCTIRSRLWWLLYWYKRCLLMPHRLGRVGVGVWLRACAPGRMHPEP